MPTFKGFSATVTDEQLSKITGFDEIDYFEADGVVTAFAANNPKKK